MPADRPKLSAGKLWEADLKPKGRIFHGNSNFSQDIIQDAVDTCRQNFMLSSVCGQRMVDRTTRKRGRR